jgi:hypothetical protein
MNRHVKDTTQPDLAHEPVVSYLAACADIIAYVQNGGYLTRGNIALLTLTTSSMGLLVDACNNRHPSSDPDSSRVT